MFWCYRRNAGKILATLYMLVCISGCTTGSAVLTGQARDPIDADAVVLYAELPTRYEVVGVVQAASMVRLLASGAEERAFTELKNQAAKLGANGVIGWRVGEELDWVTDHDPNTGQSRLRLQKTITVRGSAVYVPAVSPNER